MKKGLGFRGVGVAAAAGPHVLATTGPHTGALPLIDLEVGVQGEVIIRGVADWEALGVGAALQALLSGGAGADPYWGAPTPAAHEASHRDGGADEIEIDDLPGAAGAAGEIVESDGAAMSFVEPDGRYTPTAHGAAEHTDVERELFVASYNDEDANVSISYYDYYSVITIDDETTSKIHHTFKVPDDFVSFVSVKAVWGATVAAGNMRWGFYTNYAAAGEDWTTHADSPGLGETATGGVKILNVQEPANPLTLVNLAAGDYVGVDFVREGGHEDDTLDTTVKFIGILFTYMAEQ